MTIPTIPDVLKLLTTIANNAEHEYIERQEVNGNQISDDDLWRMSVYNNVINADISSHGNTRLTKGYEIIVDTIVHNRDRLKKLHDNTEQTLK